MLLRVAQTVACTEAEGPGRRYALWVQGCTLHCPGCCNPEMFADRGGAQKDTETLAREAASTPGIEGVSILGGEPFQQAAAVADFCERVRAQGLSVMIYSGYTLEELRARPDAARALEATDLLVDGRYVKELPEKHRRWVGSSNQTVHFLSERYSAADPRFTQSNTVELRFEKGTLTVNGWPQKSQVLKR